MLCQQPTLLDSRELIQLAKKHYKHKTTIVRIEREEQDRKKCKIGRTSEQHTSRRETCTLLQTHTRIHIRERFEIYVK